MPSRYENEFYCSFCGVWIPKSESFLGKGGALRHKKCGFRVRAKPRKTPETKRVYVAV